MWPDLFSIGFLHLHSYGACIGLGFLICWWLMVRLDKAHQKEIEFFLPLLIVMGIVGSRLAYVIENWSSLFAGHIFRVFAVWEGGLVFYGGLLLGIVTYFIACSRRHFHVWTLAPLLSVFIPLGHAFGRLGCFCYGCCYGRRSDSILACSFPAHSPAWVDQVQSGGLSPLAQQSLPVLPTQLFEAAGLILLFLFLYFLYRRARDFVPGIYLVLYAVLRYCLEFLRDDPRASVGPFSIAQAISLGIFLTGLGLIGYAVTKRKYTFNHQ